MVADTDRYDTSGLIEAQFQPGSNDTVLRNRLGITTVAEMNRREEDALVHATARAAAKYSASHTFSAADVCALHRDWLGEIFDWAGEYRHVNLGKGGFHFAAASRIPELMADFEKRVLRVHTPCTARSPAVIAAALAELHVELILIHPFRDGNGRVARMVSTLMALQSGTRLLNFDSMTRAENAKYIAAIHSGVGRNYAPMTEVFSEIIQRANSGA